MKRQAKVLIWSFVGLLAVSISFGRLIGGRSAIEEQVALSPIKRQDLTIKVVSMGTLIALRSVNVASEIQSNRAKVVGLMPEGTIVEKGDLLVEFDATPFLEEVTKHAREVKEAEANLLQAQQNLEIQKATNQALKADAKQKIKIAELEFRTLQQGRGPLTKKEFRARVEQLEEQLIQASRSAADARLFLKDGYITRNEYERAESRLRELKRSHEIAVASYRNMVHHRHPADLERARSNLDRARSHLERLEKTSIFEARRHQGFILKARTAVAAAKADLRKARADLEKTKIHAAGGGVLIYNHLPFGSETRKVQVGDSVWQGQVIMTIPDTSQMAVETSVREFDIHKVHSGQRARIKLEAFPDMTLPGRVDFIGNLATRRSSTRGGKHFSLRARLDKTNPKLRPGMTAKVEIEVETIKDALLVPIQAVFEKGGARYVHVVENGEISTRKVQLGKSNHDHAAVLGGLSEGEAVSLTE